MTKFKAIADVKLKFFKCFFFLLLYFIFSMFILHRFINSFLQLLQISLGSASFELHSTCAECADRLIAPKLRPAVRNQARAHMIAKPSLNITSLAYHSLKGFLTLYVKAKMTITSIFSSCNFFSIIPFLRLYPKFNDKGSCK